ncbi:MAG: 16S rRNA (cytosine(967)-C(5))-methyltransferase RsmB [Deltaproteobacteria bacterium]|nr:16S rRNA (cytosine(967)-C(5))-methyltransferase RsmB [Deltaproteobacteria bacterium]
MPVDPARDTALAVLFRVSTRGAFASAALRAELTARKVTDPRDRALATELAYGALRRRVQLDKALSREGKRLKDLDPKIHDPLRLATYQLLFLDRVPDHAAVNAAVDQARARGGERAASSVNAILRKIATRPRSERLPEPPPASDPISRLSFVTSLPRPLAELLADRLGVDRATTYGVACLERPSLVLRANLLRTSRDDLVAEVDGRPGLHSRAVVLPDRLGLLPQDLAAVAEGRATVEDEGSMAVVDLLDPKPDEQILDLCASPGGKATMIAEVMGDRGRVVASDRNAEKIRRVGESAVRLGLRSIELSDPPPAAEPIFDRVLVDAPCSGLGTLRRHPEIRERFHPDDLPRLVATQRSLLERGASRVRPGGVLVYAVCSVLPDEGERLADQPPAGFVLERTLELSPLDPGEPDGFFAARWKKLG